MAPALSAQFQCKIMRVCIHVRTYVNIFHIISYKSIYRNIEHGSVDCGRPQREHHVAQLRKLDMMVGDLEGKCLRQAARKLMQDMRLRAAAFKLHG